MSLYYSFIVPVYNRPVEIKELLESMMTMRSSRPYEIVIIEDGSTEKSDQVIEQYEHDLQISYYFKPNSGPGDSRNYGMRKAKGEYFIILDSDVIMPENYLEEVDAFLDKEFVHCFGGPDDAHPSFTNLQKAISFAMTSYITTGGIRGKKNVAGKFQPRSFNMGLSKEAFQATAGFGNIHPGEDPDLTLRLWDKGYTSALIPKAKVFHKRRISWKKFYTQVNKFGMVRPILNKWHPTTAKWTYWFPLLFCSYMMLSIILYFTVTWVPLALLLSYFFLVFIGATIQFQNPLIGIQAILAVLIQFYGYGRGFVTSHFHVNYLGKDPRQQFPNLFFKK